MARAAPWGVIDRLKNHKAGFAVARVIINSHLRAGGILFQGKINPFMVTPFLQGVSALLLLLLLFAGGETLSAQGPGTYKVNPKESQIEIHLFKGGFLSSFGDNHLIEMTHFSGTANLSQAAVWRAYLSGEAGSLKVIDPWGNPSERKEVEDTMLGPTQLDVNHFPAIKLRSVSFDHTPEDTAWHLDADVELHGVTRKVQFSLDCHQVGDKLQIRGRKMFKLTDFNIQPFSTAFGAVKIKNDFEVTYNIVLERIR